MSERNDPSMHELAAAYALGALSPDEARAFETALAGSVELQRDVAEYREVAAMLATAAGGPAPAENLKSRVLARVAETRKTVPPGRAPRSPAPAPLWLALAASIALGTWLGASLYTTRRELAARNAAADSVRSALESRLTERERTLNWILEPGVELNVLSSTGTPEPQIQFFFNRAKRIAMVHAVNLRPVEAGKVYQLWFIQDGKPIPSVTFNSEPDGHALVQNITVPAGRGLSHAAVTIEPAGGSPAPTSEVRLLGSLGSS